MIWLLANLLACLLGGDVGKEASSVFSNVLRFVLITIFEMSYPKLVCITSVFVFESLIRLALLSVLCPDGKL